MDKMSLISILLASVPETFLMAITSILIVGRRDLLKPTLGNFIKLSIVTAINTTVMAILRGSTLPFTLYIAICLLIYIAAYILVLKIRWHEIIVGALLVFIEFSVIELIISAAIIFSTGYNTDYIYQHDSVRILISIPIRLADLLVFILLYRTPVIIIDLKPLRRTTGFIKDSFLLPLCLFIGVMLITNIVKITFFDLKVEQTAKVIPYIYSSIFFIALLITTMLFAIRSNKKAYDKEKNEYLHTLLCIKSLLLNDERDIMKVREIISSEISRMGGKYDEK